MQTPGFDAYVEYLDTGAKQFGPEIVAVSSTLLNPIQKLESQFGMSVYMVTETYALSASLYKVFEVETKTTEHGTVEKIDTIPSTPTENEFIVALNKAAAQVEGSQEMVSALREMSRLNEMYEEQGLSLDDIAAFCEFATPVVRIKRRI
jgi:4-alpha-glucanotransferase